MPVERILARQDRLHSPSLARVDFYLLFASEGRALFFAAFDGASAGEGTVHRDKDKRECHSFRRLLPY